MDKDLQDSYNFYLINLKNFKNTIDSLFNSIRLYVSKKDEW